MRFTLHGARLVDATTDLQGSDITINGALIQAVGTTPDTSDVIIDATDMIVVPGFIDVHTHGGGGCNLHTTDVEEILRYARWVTTTGVTSFLIGVVGTPNALPEQQLSTAVQARESWQSGAEPLGIHLEGPYISLAKRGAHQPAWLRIPNESETERLLEITRGYLRLITLAPELPGAFQMIRRLVEAHVTVSVGHTDATYDKVKEAIQLGVTHATHCFNAMRPIHHRVPGPIEAIAEAPQVNGELIADGVHVHPAAMNVLVKLLGPQRTIVITDALAGAGLTNATFEFAGQMAHVICGAAHLADGTLTGSVLTMDQALRNMLEITEVSLPEAVGMLTVNPARAAQAADCKGLLLSGYDADLLLLDSSLTLQATICHGKVAFATEQWQNRLSALSNVFSPPAP